MASAAEQLASNMNFGAIAKAEELKKRMSQRGFMDRFACFHAYCFPEGLAASTQGGKGNAQPEGHSYRDIAARFGVSDLAIRKRVAQCIKELHGILRGRIQDYVLNPEDIETELKEAIQT